MPDDVGLIEPAPRLRAAIDSAINADGVRTHDLGGTVSTSAFAQAVLRHL